MKAWTLLLVFLAGCGGCASVPYGVAQQATHRLQFSNGLCSGTSVAPSVILTATHCFKGGGLTQVDRQPVTVLKRTDDGKDHSLIRVDRSYPITAKRGAYPRRGDTVFIWGHALGLDDLLRVGRVAGTDNGAVLYDLTAYKGDSGSAIFDRHGRIVGVLSALGGQATFMLVIAWPLAFTTEQWEQA